MRHDFKIGSMVAWFWHSGGNYGVYAGRVLKVISAGNSAAQYCTTTNKKFTKDVDFNEQRVLIEGFDSKGLCANFCIPSGRLFRIDNEAQFIGWLNKEKTNA